MLDLLTAHNKKSTDEVISCWSSHLCVCLKLWFSEESFTTGPAWFGCWIVVVLLACFEIWLLEGVCVLDFGCFSFLIFFFWVWDGNEFSFTQGGQQALQRMAGFRTFLNEKGRASTLSPPYLKAELGSQKIEHWNWVCEWNWFVKVGIFCLFVGDRSGVLQLLSGRDKNGRSVLVIRPGLIDLTSNSTTPEVWSDNTKDIVSFLSFFVVCVCVLALQLTYLFLVSLFPKRNIKWLDFTLHVTWLSKPTSNSKGLWWSSTVTTSLLHFCALFLTNSSSISSLCSRWFVLFCFCRFFVCILSTTCFVVWCRENCQFELVVCLFLVTKSLLLNWSEHCFQQNWTQELFHLISLSDQTTTWWFEFAFLDFLI